jgi:hypothetical protein
MGNLSSSRPEGEISMKCFFMLCEASSLHTIYVIGSAGKPVVFSTEGRDLNEMSFFRQGLTLEETRLKEEC